MLFIWLMSDSIILDLYILKAYLIFAPRTWMDHCSSSIVQLCRLHMHVYYIILILDITYNRFPSFPSFIRIHVLLLAQKWQTNDLNAKQVRLLICSCKINIIAYTTYIHLVYYRNTTYCTYTDLHHYVYEESLHCVNQKGSKMYYSIIGEEVMMMTVHSFLELIYWTSLFRITQGNAIRQRFLWYMYYIFRVHTIQLFLLRDTDILLEKATCMSGLIQTLLVESSCVDQ